MKNLLTLWETEKENWKIIDKVVVRKIVDKKPSNLVGVLRRKTDALCVRLQFKKVGLKGEVGAWKIEFFDE